MQVIRSPTRRSPAAPTPARTLPVLALMLTPPSVIFAGQDGRSACHEPQGTHPATPADASQMVLTNLDWMGGNDLVVCSDDPKEPGLLVFYDDRHEGFTPAFYLPTPTPVHAVIADDIDGDGWVDLVALGEDPDTLYLFSNDATGMLGSLAVLPSRQPIAQHEDDQRAGTPALAQHEPRFFVFGSFPGGNNNVGAAGISPDGLAVVGSGTHFAFGDFEAFRWTENTGIIGLGTLVQWGISKAHRTSSGGQAVVGWAHSEFGPEAFRWTEADGMIGLGDLPGGEFNSTAFDISGDGRVVVGHGRSPAWEAQRWTPSNGMVGLGDLPGGDDFSQAMAVSADGTVIVGHSDSTAGKEAFVWTVDSGMVALGDMPGGIVRATVRDVSSDGRVIVGMGSSDNGPEAFRWSPSYGFEALGDLPGCRFQSSANGTNFDGSVIVGDAMDDDCGTPFIWTRRHGMRDLRAVIEDDLGLDTGDLDLRGATAVSDDGRWIIGGAWIDGGAVSWLVYLGPDCPADYDGDLDADSDDFFFYLDLFLAGDRRADIDDDADNDSDDFFAFLEDFTTPCP